MVRGRTSGVPSREEAPRGALLSLANARRHLRGARALAGRRLYGLAEAHLVLGVEELAKAWVFTLVAIDSGVPDGVVAGVAARHDARHAVVLGDFFVIGQQAVAARVAQRLMRRARHIGVEQARVEYLPQLLAEIQAIASKTHRTDPFLALLHWIKGANDRKNAGMYVDLDQGTWRHPGTFTRVQYEDSQKLVSAYIRQRARLIRTLVSSGFLCTAQSRRELATLIGNRNDPLDDTIKRLSRVAFIGSALEE